MSSGFEISPIMYRVLSKATLYLRGSTEFVASSSLEAIFKKKMPFSKDSFEACMLLSAVGDALGYKNGTWEFCYSGEAIHKELRELGGLQNINIKGWIVSDDTVLHLATAEALVSSWRTREDLFNKIAAMYKESMVRVVYF